MIGKLSTHVPHLLLGALCAGIASTNAVRVQAAIVPLLAVGFGVGAAALPRARFALLMKSGQPGVAMTRLNIDPGQRFSLERKLDASGRLRILHSAAWRNYLVVTVGWALSQSEPRGGR